jgi:hypothetical protein
MGHYAKVNNGIVTQVIVADAEFFETFIDDSPGDWVKTSYNTKGGVHYNPETGEPSEDQSKALRKNYAGIDFIYDKELDAFYEQSPYASWILNEETCIWEAPVPKPEDGKRYKWNESTTSWDEFE